MSRAKLPAVLCLTLALGGLALGQMPPASTASDSTAKAVPSLEARVGKQITLTAPDQSQEKAVILQVWRLEDGRACMQAHSLKTGEPLTIVEDEKAKPEDRFCFYRWNPDGTAPAGCPLPPKSATVAGSEMILQTGGKAMPMAQSQQPIAAATQPLPTEAPAASPAKPATKPSLAGLFPPGYGKKAEAAKAPSAPAQEVLPATMPAAPAAPVVPSADGSVMSVEVVKPAIKVEPKPMEMPKPAAMVQPAAQPAKPYSPYASQAGSTAKPAGSPYAAGSTLQVQVKPEAEIKTVGNMESTQAATPVPPVKVNTAGRQTMTVHENGVDRQVVVLGEDRVGAHVNGIRVQAVDNGECFTIANCKTVCPPACPPACCEVAAPCPAPVAPCPPPCPPAKVEVVQPCPAPAAPCPPAKVEVVQPCPAPACDACPAPSAARPGLLDRLRDCCRRDDCEACKTCQPCPTPCPPNAKPCEPCKVECKPTCMDRPCDRGSSCFQSRPACPPRPGVLDGANCDFNKCDLGCHGTMLPVPMPHMNDRGSCHGPAQPCIPPYNTMESPAMRAFYGCGPAYGVSSSLQIVHQCAAWQQRINKGVDCVYAPEEAETIKNTIFLMAVLQKSQHPANRAWAADRLKEANHPQLQCFVVDTLVASAMVDTVPQVRMTAMTTLASIGADAPAVREMLARCCRDYDPAVRMHAAAIAQHLAARQMKPSQPASAIQQVEYVPSPARNVMDR